MRTSIALSGCSLVQKLCKRLRSYVLACSCSASGFERSLSVVDGDGEDRDGRAGHGVGAAAGDRVVGRGETAVAGHG